VRDSPKFFELNPHHHKNGNVLNRTSMDIDLFMIQTSLTKYILLYISVLLIETKSFGGIWSCGENDMGLYVGGRQIFETSQEVHKRGG
jgi:hypothetical protein